MQAGKTKIYYFFSTINPDFRQGINMEAVQAALALDYQAWLAQTGSARRRRKRSAETSLQEFMRER